MAVMSYREANQVKWMGVRPAHAGTQAYWHTVVNVAGVNALIPAHATRKYFITYYSITVASAVGIWADFQLSDAVPAVVWDFGMAQSVVALVAPTVTGNFWPPLEVPVGWSIAVFLSGIDWVNASMLGWYE